MQVNQSRGTRVAKESEETADGSVTNLGIVVWRGTRMRSTLTGVSPGTEFSGGVGVGGIEELEAIAIFIFYLCR